MAAPTVIGLNDCSVGMSQSSPSQSNITHKFTGTYTEVDTTKVSTPDADENYYVRVGEDYVLVTPHPTEWSAATTYYTRDVNLYVDGSSIKGSSPVIPNPITTETIFVSFDDTASTAVIDHSPGVWQVKGVGDDNSLEKYSYDVFLKDASGVYLTDPMVNIADSEDYNPIYVPAKSLLFCDATGRLLMTKPLSWLSNRSGAISEINGFYLTKTSIVSQQ